LTAVTGPDTTIGSLVGYAIFGAGVWSTSEKVDADRAWRSQRGQTVEPRSSLVVTAR
jgi:hypothetical protein